MCLACISTEYLACMSSFNHTLPVHLKFCHSSKLASPITEPLEIMRELSLHFLIQKFCCLAVAEAQLLECVRHTDVVICKINTSRPVLT